MKITGYTRTKDFYKFFRSKDDINTYYLICSIDLYYDTALVTCVHSKYWDNPANSSSLRDYRKLMELPSGVPFPSLYLIHKLLSNCLKVEL